MELVSQIKIESGNKYYLQPCKLLSDNIISHRITLEKFNHIYNEMLKIGYRRRFDVNTIYYVDDQQLIIDKNGHQYAQTSEVSQTCYNKNSKLRLVVCNQRPLSVTRFKPSLNYYWSEQKFIVRFSSNNIDMELETILPSKRELAKLDLVSLYSELSKQAELSRSFKLYITHNVHKNDLQQVIDVIAEN